MVSYKDRHKCKETRNKWINNNDYDDKQRNICMAHTNVCTNLL